jgi:hypothetical protein
LQYALKSQLISRKAIRIEMKESRELTHSDARYVAIVIHKAPVVSSKIQFQDVVVDFVGVLVESSKGVYLVVSTMCDRGIHETRGPIPQRPGHLWTIALC